MAHYYIHIKEYDGSGTEIWCGDESIEKIMGIINMLKNEGRLKQAKIYRYQGRKRVLEKVIK